MRIAVTVADPRHGTWADVLLDADPETPLRDVAAALAHTTRGTTGHGSPVVAIDTYRATPPAAEPPRLFVNGTPLDPHQALQDSPVREGSVVSLDTPTAAIPTEPDGLVEVRVVSGPGAGAVHRLPLGESAIGSDPSCAVVLDDPDLPAVAAVVSVAADGTAAITPVTAPPDGITLDREDVTGRTPWLPTTQVRLGRVLLEVEHPTHPDAALEPSEDGGGLDYNRPPRLLPPLRQNRFRLPTKPEEPHRRGIPVIAALAPMMMAVTMAVVWQRYYFLLFGLLTPVVMVANHFYDRKMGRKQYHRQLAEWTDRTTRITADAEAALVAERLERRALAPDAATVLVIAVGPRARLWERRRDDPDHLTVRVGTGDLPSDVVLEDPARLDHLRQVTWDARDVPVTLSLKERGVIGVAGRDDLPGRLAAWMIGQLAVLQSPRDVAVTVLTGPRSADRWDWVRWLPHARPTAGQDSVVSVGADTESVARRVAELGALIAARQRAVRDSRGAPLADADVVVVLDGARRLRALPGVVQLLKEGPAVGVHAICLDADERLLPEECTAVVVQTVAGLTVRQQRVDVVDAVRPDLLPDAWFPRVARALAPVRDVSGDTDEATIPASARLLDVLRLEPPTAEAITARWATSGRSTEAVVGVSLDGPFAIDLRRDGPHGLVAGTTGAGKSELLQTLVASLAVANRPDAMTFVLVDYKGGAAFKDCVDLPHTVGMVTDLDNHLVERALTSLGAELHRRERVLAAAGAKDIEDYTDLQVRDGALAPLPRLLIVIDEFASMARELPDFVSGLVNIAQRGRSLGIHLVLATQRPGGVVSPEIRANTNLRIALRVTDDAESNDVIDAPDAARIAKSTPGRAFVRLGASSLIPFQAGRVGGRRPGTQDTARPDPFVVPLPFEALGRPVPRRPEPKEAPTDVEVTDLSVLVGELRKATDLAGVPRQHSPWLPALAEQILLDEAASLVPEDAAAHHLPVVPFGVEDLPTQQARRAATIDFSRFGHLYVVGAPRSGRSQVLRTIAGSIARSVSAADVHLFGLDCGNGALLPLVDLPHCGAVAQRVQTERAQRLLGRLQAELARRQEVLATGGFADVTEQRAATDGADRLPHLVVLLDRWEGFLGSLGELDHGTHTDQVMAMLRESASVGIHLVITGDRQLLSGRMASLVEDKLVLRLSDRGDFSLAAINPRKVPESMPDGRALRSESAVEVQVALLADDASGQGQAAALRRIGAAARDRDRAVPRARRPFRVDVLPSRLTFDDAWGMRPDEVDRPLWGLVGVGGDELLAVGPDLAAGPGTFVVGGPPKSGRSTVLAAMVESFLRQGAEVVVAAPRPSPLRAFVDRPGIRAVLVEDDLTEDVLAPLLGTTGGPVVFVADDAELYRDCSAKSWLRQAVRDAGHSGLGIVIGGDAAEVCGGLSGWQVEVKRKRSGALLSPQNITDADLIGIKLPRSVIGGAVQPGRALIHLGDGDLITAQVPLIEPPPR